MGSFLSRPVRTCRAARSVWSRSSIKVRLRRAAACMHAISFHVRPTNRDRAANDRGISRFSLAPPTIGGSMPAAARLDRRQEGFAARLVSSPRLSHWRLATDTNPLASRLLSATGLTRGRAKVAETMSSTRGAAFPRELILPPEIRSGDNDGKRRRDDRAIETTQRQENPDIGWTDGPGWICER